MHSSLCQYPNGSPTQPKSCQIIPHYRTARDLQWYLLLSYDTWINSHQVCFIANILADAPCGWREVAPAIENHLVKQMCSRNANSSLVQRPFHISSQGSLSTLQTQVRLRALLAKTLHSAVQVVKLEHRELLCTNQLTNGKQGGSL